MGVIRKWRHTLRWTKCDKEWGCLKFCGITFQNIICKHNYGMDFNLLIWCVILKNMWRHTLRNVQKIVWRNGWPSVYYMYFKMFYLELTASNISFHFSLDNGFIKKIRCGCINVILIIKLKFSAANTKV